MKNKPETKMFSNIIGHEDTKNELGTLLESQRIPHGILFSGPSGVGKLSMARALAAHLLGQDLLKNPQHPDLHILYPLAGKKDIAVDSVRKTISSLQLKPYSAPRVVAIIDEADRLSTAAANSLLKTLEEPNPSSLLILISSAAHRLPPTIISRLQNVFFGELSDENISQILSHLLEDCQDKDKLSQSLSKLCRGNINILGLSNLKDSETGLMQDAEAIQEHLVTFLKSFQKLKKQIFELRNQSSAAALSLAAELGAKPNPATWPAIIMLARQLLNEETLSKTKKTAELLETSIRAEKWVKERSANPQMQLSEVFLKLSDLSL